jgi:FMN phosphatase YigB (HAD superfamily)
LSSNTECIIFDLSEVLIAGLVGIEKELSPALGVPQDRILPCFRGSLFQELLVGNVSEATYLEHVIARGGWRIDVAGLQAAIRRNFHNEVPGSVEILMRLAVDHRLVLLSDHAVEWIAYIETIHAFWDLFAETFFSFDLKRTKEDPGTFSAVLDTLSVSPRDCLFVDDNAQNVAVARSVGIPSVRFVDAAQLTAELTNREVLSYDESQTTSRHYERGTVVY